MKLDYSFLNGETKTEYSEFNHIIEHLDQEDQTQSNNIANLSIIGADDEEFTSKNIMINFEIGKDLDAIRKERANVLTTKKCNILEIQEVESSNSDRNQYILYVRAVSPNRNYDDPEAKPEDKDNCAIIVSDPENDFKEIDRVEWKYVIEIGSGILSENPQSIFGLNLEMFKEDKQDFFNGFYGNNEISRKKIFISIPTSKEEFKHQKRWDSVLNKIEDLDEDTIKKFINKEGSCGKNVTKIDNAKILTNYILYFEEEILDSVDQNSGLTSFDTRTRYLIFYENKIYYPEFNEESDSYQHIPELSNILPELPILKAEYENIALIVKNLKENGNVLDTTDLQDKVTDYLEKVEEGHTDAVPREKEIITYPNSFSLTILTFDIELKENLFGDDEEYNPFEGGLFNPDAAPSKFIIVDVDIRTLLNNLLIKEGEDVNNNFVNYVSRRSLKRPRKGEAMTGNKTELQCDYYETNDKDSQRYLESECAKSTFGCCADNTTMSKNYNNTNCVNMIEKKVIPIKIKNFMFGYRKFYKYLEESAESASRLDGIEVSAGQFFIYILKFANYFCDEIIAYRKSFARQMTQLIPVSELNLPPKLNDIKDLDFPIEDYITRNMSEEEKEKWIDDNGKANVKKLFPDNEPIANDEETNEEDESIMNDEGTKEEFSKWMGLLAENGFGLKNPEIDFMGKIIQINKIFTKNKMHFTTLIFIHLIQSYGLGINNQNNWLYVTLEPLINEVKVYNGKVKNLTREQRNDTINKLKTRSRLIQLNNDKIESFEDDEKVQALAETINKISSTLELEKVLVNDTMEEKVQEVIEEETIIEEEEEETIVKEEENIIKEEETVIKEDKVTSSASVVPKLENNEVTLEEEEELKKKAGGISSNLILIILIILLAYLLITE